MPTVKFNHSDLAKIQKRFGIEYSKKLLDDLGILAVPLKIMMKMKLKLKFFR